MDFAFRSARLPPAPYTPPPPPPTAEEVAAKKLKAKKESDARRRRNLAILSVVVVILVIGGVYYYLNDSSYATTIVSTQKSNGDITGVSDASVSLPNGNSVQPTVTPNARITISVGSSSFTQFIGCWPAPYTVGQSVSVTEQTLRNGVQSFTAALVCKGGPGGGFGGSTTTSTTTKG